MFVTTRDIRRRLNNMNGSYQIRHNINLLTEASISNVNTFEKFIDNWKDIDRDNFLAFKGLLESTTKFFNNSKSKSDCNKVVNIICEKVLPNVENIKKARQLIDKKFPHLDINNKLIDECTILIACDRVINNQVKLSKIYDVDKFIKENCHTDNEESIIDCIYELSSMIDSIDIDLDIKYNLALENILYSLDKNHIHIDRKTLLENITEYFIMNHREELDTIKDILSEAVYYKDEDKEGIDFDIEIDNEEISIEEPILEASKNPVKDIINGLKKTPELTQNVIKGAVNKIYTKSPNNIIDETPNFLSWIRQGILFSALGVNIYLGCVVLFVDKFIQLTLQRKETDKFLTKFKNERNKVQKKLDSAKTETTKKRLQEYLNTLDNNIKKIEDYKEKLYSERELDNMNEQVSLREFLEEDVITIDEFIKDHSFIVQRNLKIAQNEYSRIIDSMYTYLKEKSCNINIDISQPENIIKYLDTDNRLFIPISCLEYKQFVGDIDNLVDDIVDRVEDKTEKDFTLFYEKDDEFVKLYLSYDYKIRYDRDTEEVHQDLVREMNLILSLEEKCKELESYQDPIDSIYDGLEDLDEDDFDNITDIALAENGLIDLDRLYSLYETYRKELHKSNNISKYRMTSCLQENMNKIKKANITNIEMNRYETYNNLIKLNEGLQAIQETSVKNNILIAKEKLKKAALKFSDKEKMMSRQLDSALANFNDNLQTKLSNKNREAVIKGRILPSASTTIKIALASGVAAMFNPVFAVIGALGALGASAAGTKKEKQFILDEIEIQLKLVEKKIQLAENNNDMKALEQLLKTEQKLKRERQRILYRLKHYHPVVARD